MTDTAGEEKGMKKLAKSLANVVGDLGSLTVETYTGSVQSVIKVEGSKSVIDWENMFNKSVDGQNNQVTTTGVVKLALATHVNIDGDSRHFVADAELPDYLVQSHAEAVKNSSDYRAMMISLLAERVSSVFD
jgi:hypothetical protein